MEAAGVLSTAFGLGLLLHASQAAFFTAINGHIKTLFLHRRRLVLLSFLLCVSIYSVFQFATLLLLEDSSCSVTVRFTLFFDQAARVSALALVVWKVCDETYNNTTEKVCWVVIVGLRILLGGIIVGFTGWTFMPVCFPQPMHLATGIVHVAFDGVCWGILLFRIVAIWALFVDQGRGGKTDGKSQGYGLFLIVLSFIGWTIGSFPYLMNVGESIFVRMIPYILTLALALGVLSCFPSIVFSVPISRSDDPYNHKLHHFGSSPTRRARATTSPNFNPGDIESNKVNRFQGYGMDFDKNLNGSRTSMMFRSIIGAPIVHPGTALPWSLDTDASENITRPKPTKAMPIDRRPSVAPSHNAKPSISGPIMRNGSFDGAEENAEIPTSNPFGKVKTVDLRTAAETERQRIDAVFEREQERKKLQEAASGVAVSSNSAATPKSATDYRNMEHSTSVKRKPVIPQLPSGPAAFRVSAVRREESGSGSPSSLRQSVFAAAEGESDWGMRYSTNSIETEDDDTTRYTTASHAPYNLAAPPRIPPLEMMDDDPKVMFVNEIVYDDPALVKSIMGATDVALTTSRYSQSTTGAFRRSPSSAIKRLPGILTPTQELNESVISSPSAPVMNRPRSVKKITERGIFPSNMDHELTAQMQYNKKQPLTDRLSSLPRIDTKPLPETPVEKLVTEKKRTREIVFPIPPVRAPSTRKPAPHPITITIPAILSPEIVQNIPAPNPVETSEPVPSPKPAIPEKSEKRLMSPTVNYQQTEVTAYEAAKAWVDSVSAISDKPKYAESIIEPLPSLAYDSTNDISVRSSAVVSEYTQSTPQRTSLIALTISPAVKEDDEFTDIDIDSDSECEEIEDLEEAHSGSSSGERTQSEADEMIMNGGEGYSTEEDSYEEYFTDSEEGYLDDGVVISDIEDGTTYDKIALAERKLNAKLQGLTETLPNAIPRNFQIGDHIPTFSESRRKYGSRRKPPPSPIGFLVRQKRVSQQIEARLTMFTGNQNLAPLEDLLNRFPVSQKRDNRVSYISDGRNSLIARLEMEMGQQESQWMGMHKTMARNSMGSLEETPEKRLSRLSQNLTQRRSLLAKVNSGIDRRLSTANSSLSSTTQQNAWKMQLVDAQMEYLIQAPLMNPGEVPFKPISILESQNTPISVVSELGSEEYEDSDEYEDSEVYDESEDDESSFGTIEGEAQRKSFYGNDNSNFVMEGQDEELGDYVKEGEKDIHEHRDEIQPLQATVYCPSARSTSTNPPPQSPLQVFYTSTTESFSPSIASSPISLLWNPRLTQERSNSSSNQLWTYQARSPEPPFVFPPVVDLRPKQRITLAPVGKVTTSLWTKTHSPQPTSHTGLWKNPKEFKTKSIITSQPAAGQSRRSLKRVTFVEEVVTVEPASFFGKFKKLWGAQKKSEPAGIPAPVVAKKLQAVGAPIYRTLDATAAKYANKMLPPLPSQETPVLPEEPKEPAHSSLWSCPPPPVVGQKTLLWGPAPIQEAHDTPLFTKDTSSLRKRAPQHAVLPTLTSSTLWGTRQQSLWSNTSTESGYLWSQKAKTTSVPSHLWPAALSLPVNEYLPSSIRHPKVPLGLPILKSTELWKPHHVDVTEEIIFGLWSDRRATPQEPKPKAINYLWPTAPLLSFSYMPAPHRPHKANTPLEILESQSLWEPSSMRVVKETLWVLPAKNNKSMLWPEGRKERVETGKLWPSAPPAKKIEAATIRSRSQVITPPIQLESTSLWAATLVCEDEKTEFIALWEPASTRTKATSTEPTSPIAVAKLQTIEPKLWFKRQDTMTIASGYLWPYASEIPAPSSSIPVSRTRFTTSALPSLESRKLWSPVLEEPELWSPPRRSTGLWPHGDAGKALSSLWPSAAPLATMITETASLKRSHFAPAAISRLESKQLWTRNDAHRTEPKTEKLWEPITAQPTINKPIISEQVEETPLTLWTAPRQALHAVLPDSLWPSAPELPLLCATPATRSRAPTTKSLGSLSSKTLWGSAPARALQLWRAPVIESGLWPYGTSKNTTTLWPSAHPLPSNVSESIRTVRFIDTALQLESSQLWGTKIAAKAQLWTSPIKNTGLWPRGEVTRSESGGLWPSAAGLRDTITVPIRPRQRSPVPLSSLESYELWRSSNVTPSLWTHSVEQSSLWPHGAFKSEKKQLWSTGDDASIVRRSNLTLKMTVDEKRKRYIGRVATVTVASGTLWSRPEEMRPKFTGWLLPRETEVTSEFSMLQDVPEPQAKDDIVSLSPGLWVNLPPITTNLSSPIIALWTGSPLEAPRAKFTICRETITERKKSDRTSSSQLSPAQGKLWAAKTSSLLSGGSHQEPRIWTKKQASQKGLWNDSSTVTLEKKILLWDGHSKDRRAIFAHLSLSSHGSKQRSTTRRSLPALKSDRLWASTGEDAVNHSSSGLWHTITKPAKQTLFTLPREKALVPPRTLWQKCDKPLQPITPASVIFAVPPRSDKRVASTIPPPLFLACVGGPMWTVDKMKESRPRGLLHQTETSAGTTEKKSKLWDFSAATQIVESTATKKPATTALSMEGSLWVQSRPTLSPASPKLWRKIESSQGLGMADGNSKSSSTMTILETTVPAVATMHLWGKDNTTIAPIFADLSLESSRSRREFTTKAFSAPPEGLWRKNPASESLAEVELPGVGLWGTTTSTTENPLIISEDIPMKATVLLWQKDNAAVPMFADLPIESFRSKKDHSTITLPVFSEGMWKKKVALPERPQLWKPTPKVTGLWDANAKTKTLAQISLERKAKGTKKPLWSKDKASRTTTKAPQRSPLVNFRISDDLNLPKATGSLWKPKTVTRQLPQLWTAPKLVVKPVKPSGVLLWAQGHGSKTTTAVPERTKVAFIPSDTPLPKVSGSLWKPKSAAKPIGLWKRPIKTVATSIIHPPAPLWAARTASRTTTAIPQRLSAPKKKDSRSINLAPVTGSLWQPPRRSPVKGLWKATAPPRRPRRASLLWAAHSASRTTTAIPARTTVPKRLTDEPLQTVSGTLWKNSSPEPQKGLWKRVIPTVVTFRKTSTSTLWSQESASRTTTAKPERAPFVPKPVSEKSLILPPATGELWAPSPEVPQTITLWSRPVTPTSSSGVWDAHGRTPSLAEIKLALAARQDKTVLWQRRSVLTSKAAIIDISKISSSSVPQKKVKADSVPRLPAADGSLWRPCVDGRDEQGIMWITRSSRSSSLESEFMSPGVSRASTISDMSDESPLTTGEGDEFGPEVLRVHSTKVSVSSAAGETLWRPNGPEEGKGKVKGLWSGDVVENRRSVLVTERPARIALPGQREQELPVWDGSHSLWGKQPTSEKTLWANQNSDACSSISDEDFASAASEFSEESHYQDFEPSSYESDHHFNNPSSSALHIFVGQFRRDNYLIHQQPSTQLPENSPFASRLRIKSLRRKLRPTINAPSGERKRRNTEGEEEMERLRVGSKPMERAVSMGAE